MTQPHPHDPSDAPDEIAEYIMSITNNGRDLFDVCAQIAQGDAPDATRENRNEAIRLIIQYQDRLPHLYRHPQSPSPP